MRSRVDREIGTSGFLLNVGLTRTRVPTATPEDDRGEKAEPRRYALLTLMQGMFFLYEDTICFLGKVCFSLTPADYTHCR